MWSPLAKTSKKKETLKKFNFARTLQTLYNLHEILLQKMPPCGPPLQKQAKKQKTQNIAWPAGLPPQKNNPWAGSATKTKNTKCKKTLKKHPNTIEICAFWRLVMYTKMVYITSR